MTTTTSALNPSEIARARALLKPARASASLWPVLGAAFLLAVTAVGFATAMVLAPPLVSQHVARSVES